MDLRRPAQRRRLVAGPRPGPARTSRRRSARRSQTTYKENVPEGPQVVAGDRPARRATGNKIIFATSFGYQPAIAGGRREVPGREVRDGDRHRSSRRTWPSTTAPVRTRSTCPASPPARRRSRGTVGYVVPFAIPEVIRHTNAFALGVQKAHPGAKVKIIWTNSWFAPDKEKKAAENLKVGRRRRDRAERRQPGRRPVRRVGGRAVGRLRLERAEVRAEVVAHGRRLQLGPVLPRRGSRRR